MHAVGAFPDALSCQSHDMLTKPRKSLSLDTILLYQTLSSVRMGSGNYETSDDLDEYDNLYYHT